MNATCRLALILLILACSIHPASFGYSRITLHRTWEITSGAPFDFTAALAVNDSSQRVVSIRTDPEMEQSVDGNGTIMLHYKGNGTMTLRAEAIVDVDYDPQISSDPEVPGTPLTSSNLTRADDAIARQALELSHEESSLMTIRDLVNWVHESMTYDISYWGKSKSAVEVFKERRGVCVEYTHLLIALARSLGFQTRYVSGYVHTDSWQPHAWAEIYLPGHGWLPADATFAQAGVLDSTHLAVRRSDDQSASYDLLLSEDQDVDIRAEDSLELQFDASDPKGSSLTLDIDPETYVADVKISNGRQEYMLGSYSFVVPDTFGGESTSVMLLRPNETVHVYEAIKYSLFEEGFLYSVPVTASFNDARDEATLSVNRFTAPEDNAGGSPAGGGGCAAAALLCAAALPALAASRR